jgi:uracil-DNA glycosylase
MTFGPPVPSFGPSPARILILAEAPGEEETKRGQPLVGPSGWELRRQLEAIGVRLDECYRVNVFSRQPSENNLSLFCDLDRSECPFSLGALVSSPKLYCASEWEPELHRLHAEIAACNPNIIIALGPTACWALGLGNGIAGVRGSVHITDIVGLDRPVKVLPTFHPAAVLRQYSLRTVALNDLEKAGVESQSPDFAYDNTELWLCPSLADIVEFDALHMRHATECACDIETKRGQITCVSFAPTTDHSLVIPFWIEGHDPNYWATAQDECAAWRWVRHWLERSDLVKIFQNGLYDLTYLQRYCSPRNCTADTMLAHHSLYSELQKGLGFLGSIYCNVPSWKQMRTFRKEEQLKRDQ